MFTIQNIPYLSLVWMGIGVCITLVGVFVLAQQYAKFDEEYVPREPFEKNTVEIAHKPSAEELFAKVLEEEEKRNASKNQVSENEKRTSLPQEQPKKSKPKEKKIAQSKEDAQYQEIIQLYQQKKSVEEIAKQMKVGVGEVQLIISLYLMR